MQKGSLYLPIAWKTILPNISLIFATFVSLREISRYSWKATDTTPSTRRKPEDDQDKTVLHSDLERSVSVIFLTDVMADYCINHMNAFNLKEGLEQNIVLELPLSNNL